MRRDSSMRQDSWVTTRQWYTTRNVALRLLGGPSTPPLVWHFLVHELLHVQGSAAEFKVSVFTLLTVLCVEEDSLYAAHVALTRFFQWLGATATGWSSTPGLWIIPVKRPKLILIPFGIFFPAQRQNTCPQEALSVRTS